MSEATSTSIGVDDFFTRWEASGAAERANYQLFLSELCDLLSVSRPNPTRPDDRDNSYVFERSVTFHHGTGQTSTGRIDLYKQGCFVLEAKQGSDRLAENNTLTVKEEDPGWLTCRRGTAVRGTRGWDVAMLKAKGQAEQYARALPVEEGWPPFLVVVDVGHAIELYSEFSCSGKTYLPFPDPSSYRIMLADLDKSAIQERLRLVWTDPHQLDPAKHSAKVTREVADRLALVAKSLEQAGHMPEKVGNFLKRCLFTMFSEDVGLIPKNSFSDLLESLKGEAYKFAPMVESLWATMKDGGFSPVLREKLLRFNGGLFEEAEALPIEEDHLALLVEAAKADWKDVEPAIFGTLLERALDPEERHHLGAHYTPREYVERLVLPTIVEPLRLEWEAVLAAAVTLAQQGDQTSAANHIKEFHHRLCTVRVLDPACGSGNFLYVTFEHLKRLEGEVLNALEGFGESQALLDLAGTTVDPHQLLGIEVNPRAAAITDMVLWIGYLQWHFRTRGHVLPPEPVIKKFHNIECRDAVLAYDGTELLLDPDSKPVTRWDGRTTKCHPVTGEQVPDESAQVPVLRYLNPRKAEWPAVDFVVGNPPFIGKLNMRAALGDGYVEALRSVWLDVPDSADFVMYWWQQAAELTRDEKLLRFGFITTNSITQTYNRQVLHHHLDATPPLTLTFAIPDHPWVDSVDGADVRIAMTVGILGSEMIEGVLASVTAEREGTGEGIAVELSIRRGIIHSDLRIGANVTSALPLQANSRLSTTGVIPHGAGMLVSPEQAQALGLGTIPEIEKHIRPYRNGKDLTKKPRGLMVIDCYGLSLDELRLSFPTLFQWLTDRVKPEREVNRDKDLREKWWLHRRNNEDMRRSLQNLSRYIVTVMTAKHRVFQFLDREILPDQKLVVIALSDAFDLGVLSSRIHISWALATGGKLGVGNDPVYVKTRSFESFPFPDTTFEHQQRIRSIAEELDKHRKRQQALWPDLTLTGMYNVLEKLRTGEPLTVMDKKIHEQGLMSVLKQLHDDLDVAVFDAYGWSADLSDEEILERLVALNRDRSREEERGVIRWLRAEYQLSHRHETAVQTGLGMGEEEQVLIAKPKAKLPWPKTLPRQVQAVRDVLAVAVEPLTAEAVARTFLRARTDKVGELLVTLAALGQAHEVEAGCYSI